MSDAQAGAEDMIARLEQSVSRPLRAMIEISDHCNEVCVHCYQEQGLKGEMTTEQIKTIIDELAELGVLILTFSGGEATLRKDLLELIAHARMRGFAVRLFTNGLTMTQSLAHALAELAVHEVEISLYSHRAEVHDFVTGVAGAFEKTVAGIKYLAAEGVEVAIKTNVMSVNEAEIDDYVAFAEELGISFSMNPTPLMPREASSRAPQALDRADATYRSYMTDSRFLRAAPGKRADKPLSESMCGAGHSILVEPNGEIRPCAMLHVDMGDASRGQLRSLFESERYAQFKALRWHDAHGCRSCDLRAYCSRCHARGLAEVGDALAPYPSACSQARVKYEIAIGAPIDLAAVGARSSATGPYRQIDERRFEVVPDEVTAADDALAERLGWIRRANGGLPAVAESARPGRLVQLRRPGRARPRAERVPEVRAASDSDTSSIAVELRPQRTL